MLKRALWMLAAGLFGMSSAYGTTTLTRTSAFAYDPTTGLLTEEIVEPDNQNNCLVTVYGHDAFGNKTSVTTRNCNGSAIDSTQSEAAAPTGPAVIATRTTTMVYDSLGEFPVTVANALNQRESRTYDPRFGGMTKLIGPNQLTTNWSYDTFGRKSSETRADGTSTTWSYYVPCNCGAWDPYLASGGYYVTITDTRSTRPSYVFYDMLDRKVMSSHKDFADADWIVDYRVDYDHNGRVSANYKPYELSQVSSALSTTYIYDQIGRVQTQTAPADPSGTVQTQYGYNGLKTTVTDPLGHSQVTLKNSQGQVVSVTDAASQTIQYAYDPFGNLIQTQDAAGNVVTMSYDIRGRKTGMADPDMGTWSYTYDALGELVSQTDAKGQVSTMVYDVLGRMTSRSEPDLNSTWSYDTQLHGVGKLATETSDNGYSRTVYYDSLGRVSSETTVMGTESLTASRTYDPNTGRLSTQTYPTGFVVQYDYTAVGYLQDVKRVDTGATLWTANAMDAQGHLTQFTYGNGVTTSETYSPGTGRLNDILAGAGNGVQNLAYQYDSDGNLMARQDNTQGESENLGYDTLNRLTSALVQSPGLPAQITKNYGYDAIGNITSKSDVGSYAYSPSHPHQVTSITGTVNGIANPTFAYDANGNMTSGDGRTTTWTSFNMVATMVRGSGTETFVYDANHERAKEVDNDGTTYYLSPRYDTGTHFEKIYQSNGVTEYEHYLYAGGMMFAIYKTFSDGTTQLRYLHVDNQNSLVAVTDESGNVAERLAYDPFGKRRFVNGADDPGNTISGQTTEHGYTLEEMLDPVGVTNLNGRMYDPLLGRFISADPNIQSPYNMQSYNRYSYAWNNPMIGTDPSGFSLWTDFRDDILKPAAAVAVAIYAPYLSSTIGWTEFAGTTLGLSSAEASGMLGGALAGGIMTGTAQGALIGGLTGGAFGYAGDQWPTGFGNIVSHGVIGCASTSLSGGNCGSGALSGAFGSFATQNMPDGLQGNRVYEFAYVSAVGGTASVIGGGKFANGAETAAYGYLFNYYVHIWEPDPAHGKIGHVMVMSDSGSLLENQFPDPHFFFGINTTYSLADTYGPEGEGRVADSIYHVDENPQNSVVGAFVGASEQQKPFWEAVAVGPLTTNCSAAATNILSAVNTSFRATNALIGGIPSPWGINVELNLLSKIPQSGVQRIK